MKIRTMTKLPGLMKLFIEEDKINKSSDSWIVMATVGPQRNRLHAGKTDFKYCGNTNHCSWKLTFCSGVVKIDQMMDG